MYKLFIDSDSDVTLQQAREYGATLISMPYTKKGELIYPYRDYEVFDGKEFYGELRKGTIPSTSALNINEYVEIFRDCFEKGVDIFYPHFSRAMTATFNSMDMAIQQLKEEYPDSKTKFYEFDLLGITICAYQGSIEAMEMYKEGKSIEEIMKHLEANVQSYSTYFFADTLKFFAKSGRVSNLAGFMGNIIGIKPLLHMSSEGQMKNVGKFKGTKNAIKGLADIFDELKADNWRDYRVVLGHADAIELAYKLRDIIQERYGGEIKFDIVEVNPTAGSHCGPDTVGIGFHGKHR